MANLPDLSEADLSEADLSKADLSEVDLRGANLRGANLTGANLNRAFLNKADLRGASLIMADLRRASLVEADLRVANLSWANLTEAALFRVMFYRATLNGANLTRASLGEATLWRASLSEADLTEAGLGLAMLQEANLSGVKLRDADLSEANLWRTNLSGADLRRASLQGAILVGTDFSGADLTGCFIFGASAWRLKLERTKQLNLVITTPDEPEITVDNIEVAQFIYLLLHNEKIRDVIDTIGKKGVLLLGRFTEGRIQILERLREKLRSLGFVPMVFNFDKPETKDFTETVRLLANLSHFVIVDITNPRSAPLELRAVVPDYMVPFAPILQEGEEPFAMFVDLQNKYDWVLKPVIEYPSVDRLIEVFEDEIVEPAKKKFDELQIRRTQKLQTKHV
jgi:uncharacterized protein YjbI with pentapeptide repeats